jgi:hypothetical protein
MTTQHSTENTTTSTAAPTFIVTAVTDADCVHDVRPQYCLHDTATQMWSVGVSAEFPTLADAQAYVARLPKAWRMRAATLSGADYVRGYASVSIQFGADRANKGRNESGLKRLRAILGRPDVLLWHYEMHCLNAATPAQFDRFVQTGEVR